MKRVSISRGTATLKRTEFRIKAAKSSLPRVSGWKPTRRLKAGARMKAWRAAWRFLKPRLEAAGRTGCEFRHVPHVCGGPLDPAHSKKRREMTGNDIYAVALSCRNFHQRLDEQMTHAEMESAVMAAINRHGGMILPGQ